MKSEQTMNNEESLQLITKMITTAKQDFGGKSFYFILWGWLVFIACILQFVLLQMNSEYNGIGWIVLMPLGGIISMLYSYYSNKKETVKSYIYDVMKYVWIAFALSLAFVLGFAFKLGLNTYPLLMLIYGTWLFISGGALRFRPLIFGGIINWLLGAASFFLPFEQQLIVLGLAVLFGYIIPGHLLQKRRTLIG
jgi:hypothetical protein